MFIGGARSGKSDLAVRLGQAWPGQVSFVATATAGDDDMSQRIKRHKDERPATWRLVEAPRFAAQDASSLPEDDLAIVDCLTLLVANLMFDGLPEADVTNHVSALGNVLAARTAPSIVISNEVGLGVHPETAMGREYRDLLGRANRSLAAAAETCLFIVAGKTLPLQDLELTW